MPFFSKINSQLRLSHLDAPQRAFPNFSTRRLDEILGHVRGASEDCDQAVVTYCAEASERSNKAMRQMRKSEGGFVLLLAMLIISIILAISFSIYSLSVKEVILASFLNSSAQAFIAADRGVECALYWDRSFPQNGLPYTAFATSSSWTAPGNINTVVCDGQSLPALPWDNTTGRTVNTGKTTYTMTFADKTCVDVIVDKSDTATVVTANGYNNCVSGDPRRTQRTIQVRSNI